MNTRSIESFDNPRSRAGVSPAPVGQAGEMESRAQVRALGRRDARPTFFHHAFTRVELIAVVAVLALLAAVVLPALANNRPRSHRVICANNLRQIGMGMQLWGNDHDDLVPWEVQPSQGGTHGHPLAPNVWLHLSWLSNYVASPEIYFCPSDTGRPARDFSGDPDGGYVHPNFANRATSYFLFHVLNSIHPQNAILAGDRNVGFESSTGCSRFGAALSVTVNPFSSAFQWTNGLHEASGNLLHFDGRVDQLSNAGLRSAATAASTGGRGILHFINPR